MLGVVIGAGLVVAGTVVFVTHHRHAGHRMMFRCAMKRLGATEEQKQRLSTVFEEAQTRLQGPRERVRALRSEVADVWTAPSLDPGRLESLEARLFEAVGEGSQVMRDVVARTYEILEPKERQKVADWMKRHHGHGCHCGPYAAHHCC